MFMLLRRILRRVKGALERPTADTRTILEQRSCNVAIVDSDLARGLRRAIDKRRRVVLREVQQQAKGD